MDAYSTLIINAVDAVKKAVVKIDRFKTDKSGKKVPEGSGSGFFFSSERVFVHQQPRRQRRY